MKIKHLNVSVITTVANRYELLYKYIKHQHCSVVFGKWMLFFLDHIFIENYISFCLMF